MVDRIEPKKVMKGIRFYTVTDLAKILNITELSARVYLRQGRIRGVKVGRRWFIREKSLNDFLTCKNIREMPDDQLLAMINRAIEAKYIEWTGRVIPLIQEVVADFLVEKEKEKFNKNIKKVEEKNKQLKKVLPKKIMKHLQDRTEEIKKDFSKVK